MYILQGELTGRYYIGSIIDEVGISSRGQEVKSIPSFSRDMI
jgi:hypothetical protein